MVVFFTFIILSILLTTSLQNSFPLYLVRGKSALKTGGKIQHVRVNRREKKEKRVNKGLLGKSRKKGKTKGSILEKGGRRDTVNKKQGEI